MDWRNGGGWVCCDGESHFPGTGLWVGQVIDKEAVVIGIKGSEYR